MGYIIKKSNQTQSFTNTTVRVFTAVNATAAALLLQNYLQANRVDIISVTSSQGGGTHDLFLTSTPL